MNQRRTGISLSYLSIFLTNLIGLIYTPFLLRMMGQSEYGLYILAASIVSYLAVIDFGFGNATTRYTALYNSKGLQDKLPSLWGMMMSIYGVISLISLISGLWLVAHSDLFFAESMTIEELGKMRVLILLMTINISFSFPLSVFESIVVAFERFKFQRGLQIIRTLLQPLIMIPLLLMGYRSIALVILITALNLLYLFANLWYCFFKLKIKIVFKRSDSSLFREILQYSFWVFLIMVVDRLYWSSGQIILGKFVGTSAVAVFAVAIQFKNYMSSFSTAISGVFLPKMTTINTRDEVDNYFIKIGRVQFVIISFILSCFILFGKMFIVLWAGNDYAESYIIALIILVPLSVPLIQTLGMSILQAKNRLKFRSVVYVFMAFISVVISIPMAKLYGGLGCAISISFSLILCNILIMNYYYYKKIHIDIPRFWIEISRMAMPIIVIDVLIYLVQIQFTIHTSWVVLLLQLSVFAILFAMVVYKLSINNDERDLIKKLFSRFNK
ncbi:MAG: oligosaccharide flippase family protein [Tissierellia bacterium]|nr:oligosaccharide flippase family protein [Tissierellia bacterium]